MNQQQIFLSLEHIPELDPDFLPFEAYLRTHQAQATHPVSIALRRNDGLTSVYHTKIYGTPEWSFEDLRFLDRIMKQLLWQKGGVEVILLGADALAKQLAERYRSGGQREFDYGFMSNVYGETFLLRTAEAEESLQEAERPQHLGGHLSGCRIGFDAGGSDRKVSAVIDGKSVYSEEVVWFPKEESDPMYHYRGIVDALRTAASKLPRVDAIGVSSAGVYIHNQTRVASLFLKVPKADFDRQVRDIYIRAAAEIGADIPLVVANDGDVTALAGAMSLQDTGILGIAMGTSEAVGFVDNGGRLTGWLNELAFAPVDLQVNAPMDEWSGDRGTGCKYFSQDAVIRLASRAGIALDDTLSLAQKLKAVQALMEAEDPRAAAVFRTIGCYLGHTLPLYHRFYGMKHVLLMGRVTSGRGGDLLLETALRVLGDVYPETAAAVRVQLPDEKSRRVGQSVAAASLPDIN